MEGGYFILRSALSHELVFNLVEWSVGTGMWTGYDLMQRFAVRLGEIMKVSISLKPRTLTSHQNPENDAVFRRTLLNI